MNIHIELTPYNALTILSFLREFVPDEGFQDYKLQALFEAVEQYESSLASNLTEEQLEEAKAENQINQIIGKSPKRDDYGN